MELEGPRLKGMRDFYNDGIRVMDKYKVTKTDCDMCMLLARKNQDTMYAWLILEELKLSSPDFDRLCNEVSKIQDPETHLKWDQRAWT